MTKVYGYIRINNPRNELENQRERIEKYAFENNFSHIEIYSELSSGTEIGDLLKDLLNVISYGDKLIITEISRLTRNVIILKSIINELKDKDVDLIVLDQPDFRY